MSLRQRAFVFSASACVLLLAALFALSFLPYGYLLWLLGAAVLLPAVAAIAALKFRCAGCGRSIFQSRFGLAAPYPLSVCSGCGARTNRMFG